MPELKDSNTGELITPELITQKLAEKGITEDAERLPSETPEAETEKEEKAEKEADVADNAITEEQTLEPESSVEDEAKAKGWKPDGPKSAEEFLRAEPLYDEIKARGKEIKELKKTMEEMKQFMTKQQQLGYKKALDDLQSQKTLAISEGDVEKVSELDVKISETSKNITPDKTESIPEVQAFAEKHSKWLNDPSYECQKMREFVTKRDNELASFNLSPEEHINIIDREVKQQFKDYFKEPVKDIPQVVESDSKPVKAEKKLKFTFRDLSPEQKDCCRHFKKRGIMNEEDYIKSLIETGELQ